MKKPIDFSIIIIIIMLSCVAVTQCRETCGVYFGVQLYCPTGYHCCSPDTSYCCAYGFICASDNVSCISIGAIAGPIGGVIVFVIIVVVVVVLVKKAKRNPVGVVVAAAHAACDEE